MDDLTGCTEGANDLVSHQGLFYVNVLASDHAFSTTCELSLLGIVPTRVSLPKSVPTGMYVEGKDITLGPQK